MTTFTFTRVFIIQALAPAPKDFQSGSELKAYISALRDGSPAVPPVDLVDVSGKDEFLEVIAGLASDCSEFDEQVILHIEAHGLENECGLIFPDGRKLDWLDMVEPLAKLNLATGFNLILCVSACFGGHFVEGLKLGQPSPCFAIIGPTHITDGPELLGSFRGFYRELLVNSHADAAIALLHSHGLGEGGFLHVIAENWFFNLVTGYLRRDCSPERIAERAANILSDMRDEGKELPIEQIISLGQAQAKGFLDRSFESFFMTDQLPANTQRFGDSHLKAQKSCADLFAAHIAAHDKPAVQRSLRERSERKPS